MRIFIKVLISCIIVAAVSATICFSLEPLLIKPAPISKDRAIIPNAITESDYTTMLFLGDIMLDRGIRYFASKNGGYDFIFENLKPFLSGYNMVVANLEGPITENKSISLGTGVGDPNNFYFTFEPVTAETLFKHNIQLVDLGNNHILNFYGQGLSSTKSYLEEAGVDYFGVPEGKRSAVKNMSGLKVAFVSYNEFYGKQDAEKNAVLYEIKKVKEVSDIVIIFCHWGAEYINEPNTNQKYLAHLFVDAGADLVIGGHPHVIQTVEEYNGKKIYYSLGNFIFDMYFSENVRNGLGVEVKINKETKEMEFMEHYFYLQNNGQTILKNP